MAEILVIESKRLDKDVTVCALEIKGYKDVISVVESREEAILALIRDNHPRLIITDVFDRELLGHMKNESGARVMLLSRWSVSEDALRRLAVKAGYDTALLRKTDIEEFLAEVERLLGK